MTATVKINKTFNGKEIYLNVEKKIFIYPQQRG